MSQVESGDPDRSMVAAVTASIAAEALQAADGGVVALALGYARELDDAAAVEAEFVALQGSDDLPASAWQRLSKLEDRARASVTWAQVGPKLLAALESLGLSPAARAKLSKGIAPPAPDEVDPRKAALAAQREDELARRRRA